MELLCSCFRTNYYDENGNAITINLVAFMNEVGISRQKGNTSVLLRTIYNFNSKYSIKFYNLLRSWDGKSEASFFFSYFRSILSADAKSYHNITKFRAKVLDSSVREINQKTELTVSYEVKKRRIHGEKEPVFVFTIQKKKVDNQDKDKTPIPARAPDIPVKKQQV